jgi:hypothetical protein
MEIFNVLEEEADALLPEKPPPKPPPEMKNRNKS